MGEDDKSVATKVDTIEEEVTATKKALEKTNSGVERVDRAIQKHTKKIQQMEEEMAKINAGVRTTERLTRRRKTMENEIGEKRTMDTIIYYPEWMGGLGQEDGNNDE